MGIGHKPKPQTDDGPQASLDPASQRPAVGPGNAAMSDQVAAAGSSDTPTLDAATQPGNPGKYLGRGPVKFDKGIVEQKEFYVIEAIEGTWLSAATKQAGWDKHYGEADGYGAYVEGIVRREDGTPIWDPAADRVVPGERFAIEIPGESTPEEREIPEEEREFGEDMPEVDDFDGENFAEGLGLALDALSYVFAPLTVLLAPWQIMQNMAAVGRDPIASMAGVKARCYATTAFTFREHEGKVLPLSACFRTDAMWRAKAAAQGSWDEEFAGTQAALASTFDQARIEVYQRVARKGGDVNKVSEFALRAWIKQEARKKHGAAAAFNDHLEEKAAGYWKNAIKATDRPMWNDIFCATQYPN